jgi:hypothetical protein
MLFLALVHSDKLQNPKSEISWKLHLTKFAAILEALIFTYRTKAHISVHPVTWKYKSEVLLVCKNNPCKRKSYIDRKINEFAAKDKGVENARAAWLKASAPSRFIWKAVCDALPRTFRGIQPHAISCCCWLRKARHNCVALDTLART